ncbi:hypothetical protein [Mycobacterium sp. 1274756.6]|uniref:hypothetical protein n=1 Tax=Mycobacterium sp. 1274756.6 TaxID=1834076 RepID=UPI0007FFB4CD|nr:hypothetical protein [Mycobacterium sp. 1274756.6]OBJ69081.1 hypothetical protein A5643_12665 [Mycobacterium sp. 1274756.6]
MADPNIDATAQTVSDKLDGTNNDGQVLGYRRAAMFYDANMFGLSKDYAFPEGSNTSPSVLDQATSLAKLLTRKQTLADGNDYDVWDCIFTLTKWVLAQDPHINDDEINSVNYRGQK